MISKIINNYVIVGIWEIVEKTIGFCSEVKEAIAEHKQVPQPENKGCNTPRGAISQKNLQYQCASCRFLFGNH